MRALFAPLWAYLCFDYIKNDAIKNGIDTSLAIGFLAFLFFILNALFNLPNSFWIIGFLSVLIIIPINNLALKINKKKDIDFINNTKFSKLNLFTITITILLSIFIYTMKGYADISSNKSLKRTSDKINEDLPVMIDEITRLDKTYGKDKTLTYNYTVLDERFEEVNTDILSTFKTTIVNNVCTAKDNDKWLKKGVLFEYKYYSKKKNLIITITTSAKDCGY